MRANDVPGCADSVDALHKILWFTNWGPGSV